MSTSDMPIIPGTRIKFRVEDDGEGNYRDIEGTVIGVEWTSVGRWGHQQWCLSIYSTTVGGQETYALSTISDPTFI